MTISSKEWIETIINQEYLIFDCALVKQGRVDITEHLEGLEDQGVDGVIPVVLGVAVQHGEQDGHQRGCVVAEIVKQLVIVEKIQCPFSNLDCECEPVAIEYCRNCPRSEINKSVMSKADLKMGTRDAARNALVNWLQETPKLIRL